MGECSCYQKVERYRMGTSGRGYYVQIGICNGTREQEECRCGGDPAKCDFYPEKRKQAPKAKEPKFGEWIGVEDRLPDLGKRKLVLCDGYNKPYISTAWLSSDGMWHVADPYALGRVTHWMELPPMPKGE